jgi:hypothetical protein
MEVSESAALLHAVTAIKNKLSEILDELGLLAPSQLELRLEKLMKDSKPPERREALLKFLNARMGDLKLTLELQHDKLAFGTMWLDAHNHILLVQCPVSLLHYLEAKQPRALQLPTLSRQERGTLEVLAGELKLTVPEVLRRGALIMIDRHKSAITGLMGYDGARKRNEKVIADYAGKGAFCAEVLEVVEEATKQVADSFAAPKDST